jgi:hypothetical protein
MVWFKKNILLLSLLVAFYSTPVLAQDSTDINAGSAAIESTAENIFKTKSSDDKPENFQVRSVERKKIDSLKKLEAFWYADSAFNTKKERSVLYIDPKVRKQTPQKKSENEQDVSSERTSWLNTNVFLLILVLALAAIIFFLIKNNVVGKKRPQPSALAEQPEETENIFDINYQNEIEKAIASGNYRFATRLMFLRLLKRLAENNIIQYKQERTNLDYLLQLSSSKYYNDFFRLTRNYEYVWYGKFDPSPGVFSTIRNEFENFDNRIN